MEKTGPDKESCTCPICMYIMIEPVTMPCNHALCMYCYKQTVAQSSLVCPICRQRISVWARRAAKTNTLVDQERWAIIQSAFPEKVRRRMEKLAKGDDDDGTDDDDNEDDSDNDQDYETHLRKLKELSKPGEIRQEYDAAMKKLQQQRELEAKKEEEASAALIRALQEEEEKAMERLRTEREEQERLGLATAEQLQEMSFEELKSRGLVSPSQGPNALGAAAKPRMASPKTTSTRNKAKNSKQSRPKSALESKMNTLNNFFSPVPRTPSAPPVNSQLAKIGKDRSKKELSPYPYPCISPEDKIFYGLSALGGGSPTATPRRPRSDSCSSGEAPGLREEHSYSTASARTVDLTCPAVADQLCRERTDIVTYDLSRVKSEPEDIFGPGPSGLNRCSQQSAASSSPSSFRGGHADSQRGLLPSPACGSFRPIQAYPSTPPKVLPNIAVINVSPTKATPRRLLICQPGPQPSRAPQPASNEAEAKTKMKSLTGFGKTTAAAHKKKCLTVFRNEREISKCTPDDGEHTARLLQHAPPSVSSNPGSTTSDPSCSDQATCSYDLNVEGKVKTSCDALSIFIEDPLDGPESVTHELEEESNRKDCSVSSNKSDQENNGNGNLSEDRLLSSTTWGFASSSSHEQPLKASKCLNRGSDGEEETIDLTTRTLSSDIGGCGAKRKALSLNRVTTSADCVGGTKALEKNSAAAKQSNIKPCAASSNRKGVGKSIGKADKESVTTMDLFVQRKKRTLSSQPEEDVDSHLTQEERDHMLALQLQERYRELDRHQIAVDRFKGSVNEYSLRKKRRVKSKSNIS